MIIHISKQAAKKLDTLTEQQANELFESFITQESIEGLSVNARSLVGVRLSLSRKNYQLLRQRALKEGLHQTQLAAIVVTHALGANGLESYYQSLLQKLIGGTREVAVPSGRIDLVTPDYCIEVKMASKFKAAIGQALSYQVFKPTLKPAIALIGKLQPEQKRICRQICSTLKVGIIWMETNKVCTKDLTLCGGQEISIT